MNQLIRNVWRNGWRVAQIVGLVAIPATLLLTHVWYQFQITQLGYKISEQTERHEKLVDEHRKLTIETTVESRSERMAEVARERFGLERIEPDQIITVDPDKVRRTPDGSLDQTEHARLESDEPTP